MFFVIVFLVTAILAYSVMSQRSRRAPSVISRNPDAGARATATLFLVMQGLRLLFIAAVSVAAGFAAFRYLDTIVRMGSAQYAGWVSANGLVQRGLGTVVFIGVAGALFSATRRRSERERV